MPCLKCKNVVLANHDLVENDNTNYLVDITSITGFDFATDEDIWQKFERLAALHAAGATKTKLEQMEKAVGLNLLQCGVLGDLDLRRQVGPISTTVYDPMHCIFSNGIASQEMHLFLKLCNEQLGIGFIDMEQWCAANWKTRKHGDSNAAKAVFSAQREKASKDGFKGIASELLAIFPLVMHFAEALVRPRCPDLMKDALASFTMLCRAVALLNALKRDSSKINRQSCDRLKNLMAEHLQLFQRAHGSEQVRPKHHLCQHLADQMFAHKMVIDCWPCERKHRGLKRLAGTIDNTSHFERSLLAKAIEEQVYSTPNTMFKTTLLGSEIPAPDLAAILGAASVVLANDMRYGVVDVSAGDIIIAEGAAMRVLACARCDASWRVLVVVYDFVRRYGAGVLWKLRDSTACFTLSHQGFVMPTYWTFQSDGLLLTLLDE